MTNGNPPQSNPVVALTPAAAERVLELQEKRGAPYLRVGVTRQTEGWLNYALGFENQYDPDTDFLAESHGVKVLMDRGSAEYLRGTTIDWRSSDRGEGFHFENPNAPKTPE